MRWEDDRQSDNVEDRRGGGGMSMLGGGGRLSGGTIVIALVAWLVFDINPLTIINGLSGSGMDTQVSQPAKAPPADDKMAHFVSAVLADTEDVWQDIFKQQGRTYRDPKLVLFTNSTPTACGTGQSAMGPFYCPGDQKVYIDLGFYRVMKEQLGAPGDFAQAYVIAHEVGHHVQNLLGISEKVQNLRQRKSAAESNALSVRLELQADCLAGVWANRAQTKRLHLDTGDLEEALNAASQIGDDTLQRSAGHAVVPDAFTHGTSKQRVYWFRTGFDNGDVNRCNTFKSTSL